LPGSRCLHVRERRKAERHSGSSQSAGRCSLPLLLPGRRIAKQFCHEGTYYERHTIARDPERASARAKPDAALSVKIDKAWADNRKLYGAWKVWHVLLREGEDVARCTVERLMRSLGIKGVIRGKRVVTTNPDTSLPCPALPCPDDIGVFRRKSAFGEPDLQSGSAKQAVPLQRCKHRLPGNRFRAPPMCRPARGQSMRRS
jgi:hypothetical protein